jgi:pimeloyl-ACP methyl ester carboxylesterase
MFTCSDADAEDARAPGKVNRAMGRVHGHGYASVPGTSHMLQIEEPEACARIAADFLAARGLAGV